MSQLPSDWSSLRKRRLKRDNYKCANCSAKGGPRGSAELHVHHIVPRKDGGSNRLGNLKTLCKECHDAIHHKNKTAPTDTRKYGDSGEESGIAVFVALCTVASGYLVFSFTPWEKTILGFWVGGSVTNLSIMGVWLIGATTFFVGSAFLSAHWDNLPTKNPFVLLSISYLALYAVGSIMFLAAKSSVNGSPNGFRSLPPTGFWINNWFASGMEIWLGSTVIAVFIVSIFIVRMKRLMG